MLSAFCEYISSMDYILKVGNISKMIDKIWVVMIVAGLAAGIAGGNTENLIKELNASSKEAVNICLGLAGVMCFWSGIMRILDKRGITRIFARLLHPLLKILFPNLPKGHKATGAIAMTISANFLGLGNAATPLGVNAMKELKLLDKSRRGKISAKSKLSPTANIASDEMCMLVVLCTSGFQLIPASIIALRTAAGSQEPGWVMLPIWACSAVTVVVGIIAVKFAQKLNKRRN